MAASLSFLSLTPQTLSIHHSSSSAAAVSASSLFAIKPLPKLALSVSSVGSYANPTSRFVRNVAISSEVDSEVDEDEGLDFSETRSFSPDLKLFVGNLPFNIDSSGLAGLFEQAGNVEMVEVIYDKITGRSRGFGFVTMSTVEEVEAAAQQFDGYELQGRPLRVNSGHHLLRGKILHSEEDPGEGEVLIAATEFTWVTLHGVDNLTLETLFSEQGKVREATVVYDRESGRSRGFGFVTYSSSDEVDNAINSLDGMDINGRSIRVSRAEARPRREY
ncbi:hypothetical protein DH2020_015021 [Rehmannia glutinosa]|uniref:RRM domain-containing protein n=1 Tax=Rehmannia glutinosa TaxID=99300 RepID=A0ABR0X0P1_REHGL